MKHRIRVWGLLLTFVALCPFALSQQTKSPAKPPTNDTQQKNIQEYIELMRSNVRQEKAQIFGAVMQLSAGDAAKFWPVYNEYDAELTKLNKMRSDNILEYARTYGDMSDAKADQLITTAIDYQKQRSELLARYYGKVKRAIGAVNAARFVQIEHQLLLIIDLQIASDLPLFEGDTSASQGVNR